MSDRLTFEVVRNDGRFGPGRMDWLLICGEQLIAHCGLRSPLIAALERLQSEARKVVFAR